MSYAQRRKQLHQMLGAEDGVICLLSSQYQSRNYPDNAYMPFRQNSHFLYYTGIPETGFALLSFPDGRDILFGPPFDLDAVVWTGEQRSLDAWGTHAEVSVCEPFSSFPAQFKAVDSPLYLPPSHANMLLSLAEYLEQTPAEVKAGVSSALVEAVVAQRLIKDDEEIAAIEDALSRTREIFHRVMQLPLTSMSEAQVYGSIMQQVYSQQWDTSFQPIVTTHGEILHSHHYGLETLDEQRLLLMDFGMEPALGYASDITRTFPVNGTFSTQQREIYEVVLRSQLDAIEAMKPGVTFKDVHLLASETIVRGLQDLGLMKGDPKEAVAAGAHALFFPHGLGHMLGVDVHDMEDLGDVVGYGAPGMRSTQFGLGFLRLARELKPGHVVTIEPGIYFIPTLMDMWASEKKHEAFIQYDALKDYREFGGIRIEDDILVTQAGHRVLGTPIVKHCDELEQHMANG